MLSNLDYYLKEKEILSDIESIYKDFINNNDISSDDLYDNVIFNNLKDSIYLIYNQFDNKQINNDKSKNESNNHNKYIKDIIHNIILKNSNICSEPVNNESSLFYLENKIKYLESIPQPEQRSEEWYTFRNNRLTASDLYSACDPKESRRKYDLILKKCNYDIPFIGGDAINHGIKFEPLATNIYEKINNVKILEFGCLPHIHINYFGASPDGIVSYNSINKNYVGRMLEIKCPKSRKIDGIIPIGYYYQIQGQLEVCDLEYCDFLECDFQMFSCSDEFFNTNYEHKGIIIETYNTNTKKMNYDYVDDKHTENKELFKSFYNKTITNILEDDNIEFIGATYWYLKKINVVLVKRDRNFFNNIFINIKNFWDSVLYHRSTNCENIDNKYTSKYSKL